MYKRLLALIFLLLQNTSISAMDLNETIVIINEAQEATQLLQNEFHTLVEEIPIPQEIEVLEINNSLPQVIQPLLIIEKKQTLDTNNSSLMEKPNNIPSLSCKENNQSIMIVNGLSINLDKNNSLSENSCTDANLGTSAEGLLIFKTRIKPYCKLSGEQFAKQYMQEDWDDIYHDREFKMEVIKACPHIKERYKDAWTPDLYQFTLEYASDSDAIPEC
ncbi:MAG: Unknown protein [uncultured Sulfurovum sp.]|uniref:Uncharacterized protein n=1 Tax=uncultured Sulfurovum sp. TaxID=269237 RepID=A0A6S6T4S5_9BACT|nr:MAG: Unknown protein [uncultured Sulfurovum sp.]